MSTQKDSSRPSSQHRLSMGSMGPNILNRPSSSSRPHSHSVSLGHLNPSHRVSRRKSSTSVHGVNRAALFAAAQEASQGYLVEGRPRSQHDKMGLAHVLDTSPIPDGGDFSEGSSAKSHKNASAVVDGPPLSSLRTSSKSRNRRASEGSRLSKERRKSTNGELKCETCGKGYKHGSCLQKHLWEHTPEWALTSKLLISKHQQVQLLEAASVLVAMNHEKSSDSDASSDSPPASGTSDPIEDEDNSSRTSSPEQEDEYANPKPNAYRTPHRQDSYSSVFSRSYASTAASSLPNDNGFQHHRRWSSHSRPSTGVAQTYAEEQADIAAAAEGLVNCSIGTPQSRPFQMESDVPPVPPLPAKFAHHAASSPFLRPQYPADVDMSDEDRKSRGRGPVEDDEDGVFGRMEQ